MAIKAGQLKERADYQAYIHILRRCCGWNEGIANTCREDKHEALF